MKKIVLYTAIASLTLGGASFAMAKHHCKGEHHKGKMFEKIDSNSDGVITQEEFLARHTERFATIDANHDGKVTKEEMQTAHEDMKKKWKEKRKERKKDDDK